MAQFTDPRLQRQFAMARGLRDQSMSPQGGQMVSGHYVGGGPLDAVRQLAQAYQGNKMFDQANQSYNTQQQQLLDALRGDGGLGQGQMPMQGATPGINPQQPMNTGMANALPKSGSSFPSQAGQGQYNQPDVIDRLASLDNPMARQMAIDMQLQRMSQQPQGRFRALSQDEAAMMGLPSNSVWQISPEGEIKPAYEAQTPDYNDLIMLGPNGEPIINEQLLAIKRQLAEAGRPETNIEVGGTRVDMGKESEQLGKQFGDRVSAAADIGGSAQRSAVELQELNRLLSQFDSGAGAAFKSLLGNYGVNTDGLSEIQAAEALINRLVPQQRPAGSGPMSDADLELFKRSLPRIINTPNGNRKIMDTLMKINEYDRRLGQIADAYILGDIDRRTYLSETRSLGNPLADIRSGNSLFQGDLGARPDENALIIGPQ